jgi:hypothetical protein
VSPRVEVLVFSPPAAPTVSFRACHSCGLTVSCPGLVSMGLRRSTDIPALMADGISAAMGDWHGSGLEHPGHVSCSRKERACPETMGLIRTRWSGFKLWSAARVDPGQSRVL